MKLKTTGTLTLSMVDVPGEKYYGGCDIDCRIEKSILGDEVSIKLSMGVCEAFTFAPLFTEQMANKTLVEYDLQFNKLDCRMMGKASVVRIDCRVEAECGYVTLMTFKRTHTPYPDNWKALIEYAESRSTIPSTAFAGES